jgi:hypothetical protein
MPRAAPMLRSSKDEASESPCGSSLKRPLPLPFVFAARDDSGLGMSVSGSSGSIWWTSSRVWFGGLVPCGGCQRIEVLR